MAVELGSTLGQYEILASLGVGGMGEVYRARDTRLGREVAIKVLPGELARDEERLARFEREARVLASLNHPNIATLHGFFSAVPTTDRSAQAPVTPTGSPSRARPGGAASEAAERAERTAAKGESTVPFLVMELVEGETLADRFARAPLPVDEVVRLFLQITEGLEAAHAKGIVHRDLKPANVKITRDGTGPGRVKILDFGLAKALSRKSEEAPGDAGLTHSPTLTMAATMRGQILGTAAYMAPEQARGGSVDARADLWAFGCLLYEALTGAPVFAGETVTDVLAAVVTAEPDWKRLPSAASPGLRRLLRRCLRKDPSRRLHHVADARIELLEHDSEAPETRGVEAKRSRSGWVAAAVAAAVVLGALGTLLLWSPLPEPESYARTVRFELDPGDLQPGRSAPFALSPGGTLIAYVAGDPTPRLHLRPLDQLEPRAVPGTEGAEAPFFSADGDWLGYLVAGSGTRTIGSIQKVSVRGGSPLEIYDGVFSFGASWGSDGTIVFPTIDVSPLFRISEKGGDLEPVTTIDTTRGEVSHRWPQVLPGGEGVLFTVGFEGESWDDAEIAVKDFATGERETLVEAGTYGRYAPSGHLVFSRAGKLLAVPWQLDSLAVTGTPVPVVDDVAQIVSTGLAFFDLSQNGDLVYLPGGRLQDLGRLVVVDRDGTTEPLSAPPRSYYSPRISPDGGSILVGIDDVPPHVWSYDLERETLSRMTFEAYNRFPLWTPDGTRIAFSSNRGAAPGSPDLFWRPLSGEGAVTPLARSDDVLLASSWSPDGRLLLVNRVGDGRSGDVMVLDLEAGDRLEAVLTSPFVEGGAVLSPEGGWLAYASDETGRPEVYVQTFPAGGGKRQVSVDGGTHPLWSRDGRELFYLEGDAVMVVDVTGGPEISMSRPRELFRGGFAPGFYLFSRNYDVFPDGRFLMIEPLRQNIDYRPVVVTGWANELARLVPPDG